ncbi:MAG: 4-hydroxybenzoate octaprenyltransferase [Planctomycetota bacterium]
MEAAPLQPAGGMQAARLLAGDIKIAHSVFALPFALLAAVLAAGASAGGIRWQTFAGQLALILACMVAARTWAMLANRLADRTLDAANPRTRGRPLASGRVSLRAGGVALFASAGVFLAACGLFGVLFANWWPLALGVPVLLWIAFYAYTKRFTWLCHAFLGGALAASPLAAAIAIGGIGSLAMPALWAIASMVVLWVGGFDVIYALQDLEHDRRAGLNSIPARFGWRGAAWISRGMHAAAVACLVIALAIEPRFGVLFLLGVLATVALLAWEHAVLVRRGQAGIPMAFFTLNGVISVLLGGLGISDVLLTPLAA